MIALNLNSFFPLHRSRMPGPMANREYLYARRVWRRPDGSCYHISVSSPHDQVPKPRGRNVRVDEFGTAFIMRWDCVLCSNWTIIAF